MDRERSAAGTSPFVVEVGAVDDVVSGFVD
jgi:hypothetical protein